MMNRSITFFFLIFSSPHLQPKIETISDLKDAQICQRLAVGKPMQIEHDTSPKPTVPCSYQTTSHVTDREKHKPCWLH